LSKTDEMGHESMATLDTMKFNDREESVAQSLGVIAIMVLENVHESRDTP